jgi:glutathione S-transferase
MRGGRRTAPPEPLAESRARCGRWLDELPSEFRQLQPPREYPVARSAALEELTERTAADLRQRRER